METKNKKIIFTVSERQKEDFKVRLQYDGLTQANFFRAVMIFLKVSIQNYEML